MKLTKHETKLLATFIARGYTYGAALAAVRMMVRGY